MEGYFPIHEYCRLSGCNTDTAYHRAIRGNVDSFKDKDERLFIYFTDYKTKVPEGFITIAEYAKRNNMSYSSVDFAIRNNRFNPDDVYRIPKHSFAVRRRHRVFIRPDAERNISSKEEFAQQNSPEGYITMNQWGAKNNVSRDRIGQMVRNHRIETLKVGTYRYIKEGTPVPLDKRHKENRQ